MLARSVGWAGAGKALCDNFTLLWGMFQPTIWVTDSGYAVDPVVKMPSTA